MQLDFSALRIAVIGDLILDRYVEGSAERLSPEAPVPVLLRQTERDVLGGAANVAANLACLGAQVAVAGVIGRDAAGARIVELFGAHMRAQRNGLVSDDTRPTTSKTRVISGLHQLVRIDNESSMPIGGAIEDALLALIDEQIAWADAVILSDYAKGVCTDRLVRAVIDTARERRKISIIDPKRKDFAIYRHATVIKPNRRELSEATHLPCTTDAQAEKAAESVIAQTGSAVLLTRSEQGLSYFGANGEILHLPTTARDVFDVSGAGDTVVAVTALGLAARMSTREAMRLANVAAGIVVGKVGTAVLSRQELEAAIAEEAHHPTLEKGALVSLDDAVRQREQWRRRGLRVGFTNGCYDLLHPGHIALLKQASAACDRLIVAINTDSSVKRLKGLSRPVQDEASRAYVLGAVAAVDLVMLFDEDTPARAIDALMPDLLVKGADYEESAVVGADVVRAAGGEVMLVPIVEGQSTSGIIRRSTSPSPAGG